MVRTVVYECIIPADRDTVFQTVPDTTANWPRFFTGFRPFVGAITEASIEGGGPVVAGARRHIGFSDGSRIVEQIIDHDRPRLHHYRVPEMTRIQAATMSDMDSTWELLEAGPGRCRIRWTYRLTPKSMLTAPLVATVGAFGFWGAMRACLGTIRQYFGS